MKDKKHILWKLFVSTLYLSTFTFGGGYVIVTLMKNKFVDELGWIEEKEMLDMVAIAQSSPGPIAVNGAIVIGYKLCGIIGAGAAVLGAVIPPFVILTLISGVYEVMKDNQIVSAMLLGMQSGVAAVIASVVYDMGKAELKSKSVLSCLIMLGAFLANYVWNVNVVYIILLCAALGVIRTLWTGRKEGRK
ncbi:chromate transporter [Bariatricus massiliensis]|uniref:Chromate transporter n=1 Tax=Bariatricus massiliensis TaxID=1745713 RepID=A0ABS8DF76_9FIRM|nr:chromate transporter [Bariatricus massiliensis]MCB7302968.1 chromate transporter [Bariatricus massiliensis]MCB7374184.1 chromate transporter [Bariatricus massiliensis]MCB7386854.1 chromate transporter [Bariatricus massiliensis]MCB7411016.1 chromate transporter [Bariatricus massiliensis]MCQ5251842.1 chromate transporter [Bariatricus massiliensis]